MMSYIKIEHLSAQIEKFLLDKIDLEIAKNEYFVLLGQSGSGKTKLLETIAGVNESSGGVIYLDGQDITMMPPEKRDFGFVYQSFALFPNMNVKENIKFADRYKKIEGQTALFDDLVGFLQLQKLLERDIDNLSGGEKQRVALARALYSRPKVLLLDEPLSAIDPTFRNAIMKSLKDIHQRYNLTTIHVTHNFREASFLADTIAIIIQGKIAQVGKAKHVLHHPANIEVARFLGFKNIFPATMLGYTNTDRYYTVDPNAIRVSQRMDLKTDYIFTGTVDQCMGIVDHYKIFIRVQGFQFFVKILNRDYEGCFSGDDQTISIGFNKDDVAFV
ncbi:MAG: ABC transporter ATP-binding protein [Campylobacterota bacterium]